MWAYKTVLYREAISLITKSKGGKANENQRLKFVSRKYKEKEKRYHEKGSSNTKTNLYDPLARCSLKPLSLQTVVTVLENLIPDSILFSAIPSPKIDFVSEIIAIKPVEGNTIKILSVAELILDSGDKETLNKIEQITQGQSSNKHRYQHRKSVINASKAHEAKTKLRTFKKTNCEK